MSDAGGTFVQRVVFEGDAGPLVEAIRQVSAATSESIARAREQVTSGELAPGDYTAQLRAAQTQLETIIAESRAAIRELGGVAAPQSLSAVTAAATAARREQSRAGVAAGVEGFVPTAEAASAATAAVGLTAANERIVVAANTQAVATEEAAAATVVGAAEEAKVIQKKIQLRLGQIQVLRDELQLEETTLSAESGLAAITTEYDLLRGRAGARASYNYQAGKAAGAVPPDQATLDAQAIAESELALMKAQAEATAENQALQTQEMVLRQQIVAELRIAVETEILQNQAGIILARAYAERAAQLSIAAKRELLPIVRSIEDIQTIGSGQAAQKLSNTQEAAVRERTLAEEGTYAESLAERNLNAKRSAFASRDLVTLETTQADVAGQALVVSGEKLLAERQRIGIAEASLGREIEDLSAVSDITVLRARRVVLEKALATQSEAQLATQAEQLGLPNPNQSSSGGRGLFGGILGAQGSGLARGLVGGFGAIAVFAGLRESVTYAVELEKALTAVQSRMDALGQGGQFEALRGHILEMSRDSGQSAVTVSAAAVRMTAAFGDVTQGVAATESAIKLAVVAGTGLSETADQLIAIGKAYNLTGQQVDQISDTIFSAATRFGITVGELTRGMATLAESGQFAGLSLSEQANILSKVAQVSQTDANQAAERLTRILPLIDAKANQLIALSREDSALGAVLKPEDFAGADSASRVFKVLGENFNNFSQQTQSALLSIVGSGRGAQSLLPIFANFNEVMAASADSAQKTGGVNEAYRKQQETLAQTVKRLREELNQLTLALTNSGVLGAFNNVLGVVERLVKAFNELNAVTDSIPGKLAAILIGLKALEVVVTKLAGESAAAGIFGGFGLGAGAAGAAAGAAVPAGAAAYFGTGVGAVGANGLLRAGPAGVGAASEFSAGVPEVAIGLFAGSEINRGLDALARPDLGKDNSLLKLEEDFKNTERNKRRATNNLGQIVTQRLAAVGQREDELKKKILALDPSVDFKDIDAAIKKQQSVLDQNRAIGDQAVADQAAATAAENAPISEQPIAAVKAAYDAGVITAQAYLNRLTEERRITLDLAKSGVQRNTNLVAAANMTKEINTLVDQQSLAADQLITAMENATGDPNASANNISRLVGRLSGPNQLLDPADRQKVAAQIYDAERKQLDDMVGRAQSATSAAQIGAQGIRVPDSARTATLVAQITASNPKFVQALAEAAGNDKDLGQAILEGYAARVVAGENQHQALLDSINAVNAQRKKTYDAEMKLYQDNVLHNRRIPAAEREPPPVYTPIGVPSATDTTGAPGATVKETPDQQAAREKAERSEQRQLDTEKVNAEAALAVAKARGNAFVVARAEVDKAVQEQVNAENQLADAGKDPTLKAQAEIAKTKALADKIKADHSLEDVNTALIDAQMSLTEALANAAGDTVAATQDALDHAKFDLSTLIAKDKASGNDPNKDPAVLAQKALVAGAQKTATDTQHSTADAREKFLLDTHKITVGAYIAYLQSTLTDVTRSTADLQRIQLEVYNLQTQGSGPFNIPSSIRLPTLYEVRRFQAAEQGQTSVDNRTINVQMYVNNGMDQAAATQWLTDITQGGSSVLGTVTRRYP